MKKVVLILAAALTLVACKNKNQNNQQTDNGSTKSIVIDTTNVCYKQSFVFDVQYTYMNGKNDTLRHMSYQPSFTKTQNGKWSLVDPKTSNLIAEDVKSYKSLPQYFDTTMYISCCGK